MKTQGSASSEYAGRSFGRDGTGELRVTKYRVPVLGLDAAPVVVVDGADQNSSKSTVSEGIVIGAAGSFETPMVPGSESFQNLPLAGVIFTADSSKGDLA